MRNSWTFLAIVLLAACDDGGSTTNQLGQLDGGRVRDAFVDTDGGPRSDARVDRGAGGEGGGGRVDMGGIGGEGGNGGAGGGIRMLSTCEDICGVYSECNVEAEFFPGGRAACLTRCAEAERSDRFVDYLTCMQITRCDQLQRCTIPERPLPPCADVCTALASCDPAPRLPAGLPGIADCAGACADATLARVVARCGQAAVDGVCDGPAFDACVLAERGGACGVECRTRAGCDLGVDAATCTLDCLNAQVPEDPVAARRVDQAHACVRNAADCNELAACDARIDRPIVGEHTVEDLCAANATCGFMAAETCPEVAADLLGRLADGAVDCFTDHFTHQCDEPPYGCFTSPPAPVGGCEEHCLVSDLCGLLPDGQTEFECLGACQAALATGDPVAVDPYLPFFECAFLNNCADILACHDRADTDAGCRDLCVEQVACNTPGARECYNSCLEHFVTERSKAERACTRVADGCDHVALCTTPEPPDCAALCGPLDVCGLTDPRCAINCDNAHFAQPAAHLPQVTCVNATARCQGRAACIEGDLGGAELCLSWCKARVTCSDNPDQTLEACALECARGQVTGQRGLVLASASPCLEATGSDGSCAELRACINGADFSGYCPDYCADLARCRLTDDVAACTATCRGGNQGPDDFVGAACTLNARRRGESCEAIARCVGAELPEIPRACRDLCEAQARCDESVDPFLCGVDCDPNTPGLAVQAGCARFAACDQQVRCENPPAAIPRGCAAACGVVAACPGLVGPGGVFDSFDHCNASCAGATILLGAGFPMSLQQCAEDAACDAAAVTECFTVPEDICEAGLEAVTACGLDQSPIPGFPPLVPDYLAECRALQRMDPAAAAQQVQCLQ